jgi:hypothetical protein
MPLGEQCIWPEIPHRMGRRFLQPAPLWFQVAYGWCYALARIGCDAGMNNQSRVLVGARGRVIQRYGKRPQ